MHSLLSFHILKWERESASDASGSSASTPDAEPEELVSDSSDAMYFLRALATLTGFGIDNPSLESEDIEAFARTVCFSLSPCLNFTEFAWNLLTFVRD